MRRAMWASILLAAACATTGADIRQLGRIGDVPALVTEWDRADSDAMRLTILQALEANAAVPAARRVVLAEASRSRSESVRVAAVRAAGKLDGDDALEVLIAALADSRPAVREVARAGLAKKGATIRAPLNALLASGSAPHARSAAAKLLGALPASGDTVTTLIGRAQRDDAPAVREASVVALGRLGIGRTRKVLQDVRRQDDDASVRMAAERALERLGDSGLDRVVVAVWPIKNATGLRDPAIKRSLQDLRRQLSARIGASRVAEVVEEDQLQKLEAHWLKLGDNMYDGDAPNLVGPGFAKIATQFIYGALSRSGNEMTLVLNRIDAATGTQVPGASVIVRGYAADLPQLFVDASDRVIARFR